MPLPRRYTLYYRLIDASFVCQLLMVAAALFKAIAGVSAVRGILYYPFAVVAVIALLLPPILIFQRWMRDDFSEQLWQRTAGTVLKALILLPLPLMVAISSVVLAQAEIAGQNFGRANALNLETLIQGQVTGFIYAMLALWFITPLVFVFAFQWHRWRASR